MLSYIFKLLENGQRKISCKCFAFANMFGLKYKFKMRSSAGLNSEVRVTLFSFWRVNWVLEKLQLLEQSGENRLKFLNVASQAFLEVSNPQVYQPPNWLMYRPWRLLKRILIFHCYIHLGNHSLDRWFKGNRMQTRLNRWSGKTPAVRDFLFHWWEWFIGDVIVLRYYLYFVLVPANLQFTPHRWATSDQSPTSLRPLWLRNISWDRRRGSRGWRDWTMGRRVWRLWSMWSCGQRHAVTREQGRTRRRAWRPGPGGTWFRSGPWQPRPRFQWRPGIFVPNGCRRRGNRMSGQWMWRCGRFWGRLFGSCPRTECVHSRQGRVVRML